VFRAWKFGGTQHIVDGVECLQSHGAPGSFDLIFGNAVHDFGLDRLERCEPAIEACWSPLRPGGYFVFGWDEIAARIPVPLDAMGALNRFQRCSVATLGSSRYLTHTPYRHSYDAYRKAELDAKAPR
jgi:hypothetical protein